MRGHRFNLRKLAMHEMLGVALFIFRLKIEEEKWQIEQSNFSFTSN